MLSFLSQFFNTSRRLPFPKEELQLTWPGPSDQISIITQHLDLWNLSPTRLLGSTEGDLLPPRPPPLNFSPIEPGNGIR